MSHQGRTERENHRKNQAEMMKKRKAKNQNLQKVCFLLETTRMMKDEKKMMIKDSNKF